MTTFFNSANRQPLTLLIIEKINSILLYFVHFFCKRTNPLSL